MNSFVAISKLKKTKTNKPNESTASGGLSLLLIANNLGLSLDELNRIKLHTLLEMVEQKTQDSKNTKTYGNPSDFSSYF